MSSCCLSVQATLLIVLLSLSGCSKSFLGEYLGKKYGEEMARIGLELSADMAIHGIEMECFKYELGRWPSSFSEMLYYQSGVLPCVGISEVGKEFWERYPTASVQGIDDQNALIIVVEMKQKDGSLKVLTQPVHVNYHIEYHREFSRIEP